MNNDLISREALKKAIEDSDIIHCVTNLWYADILKEIDNAPTVDAIPNAEGYEMYNKGYVQGYEMGKKEARPQGEWIIIRDKKWGDNVKCPFCEKELAGTDLNFCCKCGAKLIGSEKMNGGAV